jgi:predicted PurR-regulated permease PerM
MTWVGALVLGLPYGAALALVAAVGELVPSLGPIIAAIPLIAVGFLSSPSQGLLAVVLAILVQQPENNLVVPRVEIFGPVGMGSHSPPPGHRWA